MSDTSVEKRIGIAFGGGGARGFAHLGVIRAFREHSRIEPTFLSGTSAGSIAAACYAAGLDQDLLEETAADFTWFQHVISLAETTKYMLSLRREGGLLSNTALEQTINALIEERTFDDLDKELAVVAVDLDQHIRAVFTSRKIAATLSQEVLDEYLPIPQNGKSGFVTRVITDVPVGVAVRASCTVPGLFHPVEVEDMRLVDGGIIDQVPVNVVKAMGAGFTFGISLGLAMIVVQHNTAFNTLSKTIEAMAIPQIRRSLDMADIGFQVTDIERQSPIKLKQTNLIEQGEADMLNHLRKIPWLYKK